MKLKRDHKTSYCGQDITLPRGTKIMRVRGKVPPNRPPLYAVALQRDLVALTGNTHDPKYHYCFVPAELVDDIIESTGRQMLRKFQKDLKG